MSSVHTVMTSEVFHSIDSSDLSSLSSQDKFQYHLWMLYISMSDSPDLDFNLYLTNALISFESRESPVDYSALPPPHPDGVAAKNLVDSTTSQDTPQDTSQDNSSVSVDIPSDISEILQKPHESLTDQDFENMKSYYQTHQDSWGEKNLRKNITPRGLQWKLITITKSDGPKKSSPKKSSPKKSSPKKSSTNDDQSEIAIARDTYFKLFQKKAGRMKLENILKRIAEAQADTSADTPADTSADTPADTPAVTPAESSADTPADTSSVKPEDDPDATQDVYPDDLEPDENEYSKYIHEGVEYLHDTCTDQLIGSDNKPWANIDNDGTVTFLSQEYHDLHKADGDYEAPDCDDDTEVEDNDDDC